ncbi:MAG: type II toxin-antitoxin system VapC family toxin [Devosia sp.]|nr:type II toxin-antitoxin system VapC family toxin [Devosia sp.]
MTARLLLDTCAAIWITENQNLSEAAATAIDDAYRASVPVLISPITAWERGLLVSKGRIASPIPSQQWFERLVTDSGFKIADMTPAMLIDSSFLPGTLHGDPADRIIIATARTLDLTVVTRDRGILEYAEAGHVRALPC